MHYPSVVEMNVRRLNHWATIKRAKDSVHVKQIADIEAERGKHGRH